MAGASKADSLLQSLKHFMKAPWKWTGPCASPEYLHSVPKATEYRIYCPATITQRAIIPTANPEHVFDIKYFPRDQRRNRPPIQRTILKKADVQKMKMEKKSFEPSDFPMPYLTTTVEEDYSHIGGGYQK